jgi:hypothetical protein
MSGIKSAYDVGRDEFAVTGHVPYVRKYVVDYDDLDATAYTYNIQVPAGTLIRSVAAIVTAAFAGGTPTIDIGDGSDVDGFIDSTNSDLAETVLNDFAISTAIAANTFAEGKYYAAAGVVQITGSAALSAGQLTVLVEELRFEDSWRASGEIGQSYPTYVTPTVA